MMESDEVFLKDITYNNEQIFNWLFKQIDDVRIYYKPYQDIKTGFSFCCIKKNGYVCNEITDKNQWDENYCMVDVLFSGVAYFDGVRHLNYGSEQTDNEGYHYYPDTILISNLFKELNELEKQFCRENL